MKSQYILLICAGALFVVLFICFIVVAIKRSNYDKHKMNSIKLSYLSEDLKKMGYDFAYSEDEPNTVNYSEASQVTIDDIVGSVQPQSSDKNTQQTDDAFFSKIENDGVEEITGNFKS